MKSLPRVALLFFPFFLVIYELTLYLANDAYLPALIDISHYFDVSDNQAAMTLTAFFLGNASFQLLIGPLSDQWGRRKTLFLGAVSFFCGSLFCAYTSDFIWMLVGRFLQGFAVTTMSIAGYSTIHAMFDEKKAIQTLSWMHALTVLAPAFGPIIGAYFLLFFSWKILFLSLAVIGIFCLFSLIKVMPETAENRDKANIKTTFVNYKKVLINIDFMREVLSMGMIFAANIAWIAAGPLIIMHYYHLSAVQYGGYQILIFSGFILGSRYVKKKIETQSAQRLKKSSLKLCLLAAMIAFSMLLSQNFALLYLLLTLFILSFASGISFPIFNRLAIDSASEPMGVRMAVFSFVIGNSAMFGSLMVNVFYRGELRQFLAVLLVFCVLLFALQWLKLKKNPLTLKANEEN